MLTKLNRWFDERTSWRLIWETIFLRKIPKVNWFYTLGSATLFLAVNQAITGILLTIYYVPTPDHAYDSVQYITTQVPLGWLIRGLHHWGASAMIVLVGLHMLRVILFGAYKYPREVTWFTGVILLLVVIGFGFTGYLLPWDQKAYWATTVGTRIAGAPPLIGDYPLHIIRGGPEISAITLVRFFGTHVWVLPALLASLIGVHLYLVIRNGISAMPRRGGDQ
ncbi:MAG TPA: cytochrome b N-terminal domain-containing protein [Anaerolineales bacterium]